MSPDQKTGRDIRIISHPSGNDPIRGHLNALRSKGEYLIKQLPTEIDNDFLIELEGLMNSLYTDLDKELTSGKTKFKTKSIQALMKLIDDELLPVVSGWSDFAKKHPTEPRPREIFKNIKSVGGKVRDLHKKI